MRHGEREPPTSFAPTADPSVSRGFQHTPFWPHVEALAPCAARAVGSTNDGPADMARRRRPPAPAAYPSLTAGTAASATAYCDGRR
jgi:hypothetical protein